MSLADSPAAQTLPPDGLTGGALPATPLRRGAAWIVDFAIAFGISMLATAPLGDGHLADILGFSTLLAVWYLYLVVLESTWHRTPGQLVAGIAVRGSDGAPCGWQPALLRNLTKALLTPWAGALAVTLVVPGGAASDAAFGITILAPLAGLLVTIVLMRRDPAGRSLGDRMAGTVVVRTGAPREAQRQVPSPVAVRGGAVTGPGDPRPVVAPVSEMGRRHAHLTSASWGTREVVLASLIGLGPLVALDLLSPFHLSRSAGLLASVLALALTVVQDAWFLGWAWGFSLRRYHLGLVDWGFRRPGLAILWLVPVALFINVVAEFLLAPLMRGPARDIGELFPHTIAGGVLLVLASCVVAPVMEESFYRGFLFRGLLKACRPWLAAVISAAVFAGMHWDLRSFAVLFVGGLLLAWLYYRTDSLWTSIALHASINGLAFIAWLVR